MATTGALPTLPGAIGADAEAQREYTDAISKVLASLENRNQPNLFNVAGAFLNPGRTGNIGEALGNVATTVGRDVEAQRAAEPSIAMMRAQLAGQKYEIGNQGKALNLLANTLGMEPAATTQAISSGTLPQSAVSKITPEIYTTVSLLYPKLGETLKNAFGMDVESKKLGFDLMGKTTDAAKIVIENGPGAIPYLSKTLTQNMPGQQASAAAPSLGFKPPIIGQISSGFGERKDPIDPSKTAMHNGIDFSGTAGAPVSAVLPGVVKSAGTKGQYGNMVEVEHKDGSISYYAHLDGVNVKPGDKIDQGTPIGTIGATGKSTGAHVEFGVRNANGRPIDPTPLFGQKPAGESVQVASTGNEGLPLAKQTEVGKTRVLESDKPFQAKVDMITNYTPQVIGASNRNLDELDQLAGKYPRAFGLMKKQGLLSAIQAAANQGLTASAGQYSASLSLPVKTFLEKYRLSETEQDAVTRASQIIGEEFLNNVKTNKGLLGVNPTDNDARLLQAPMASLDDSARAVQAWSRRQTLVNMERGDLYSALDQHRKRVGATAPPSSFFSSKDYTGVLDTYAPKYKALELQIGPLAKPQQ
jgi:murein DD-endopeptidase MepM/ murein hydrolase activator NlpD